MGKRAKKLSAGAIAGTLLLSGCGLTGGESVTVLQQAEKVVEVAEPGETGLLAPAGSAATQADLDKVNDLVPLRANLDFEFAIVDLASDRALETFAPVPSEWNRTSSHGVEFDPPSTFQFEFLTAYRLSVGCSDACEAQDWEAHLMSEGAPLEVVLRNAERGTLLKDRALSGPLGEGRSVMVQFSSSTEIDLFRWSDNASAYLRCSASIDSNDAMVADAFLAACEAADALWFEDSAAVNGD